MKIFAFHSGSFLIAMAFMTVPLRLTAQDQVRVTWVDSLKLPSSIKHEGKFRKAIRFTDGAGDHLVVLTQTGVYRNPKLPHEEDGLDSELFAYHYLMSNGQPHQTWKVYDFIMDCPLDLEATFLENAFQVTDLNKDGAAEVWLIYKTICTGDVSPHTMKIIMYQGHQKFAMRGRNKIRISDHEFDGGEYTFDQAFANGPQEFQEFARKLWNQNIMQSWD